MAENDAPEASQTAANDAADAAGGSDAPIEEADGEPTSAADADADANETAEDKETSDDSGSDSGSDSAATEDSDATDGGGDGAADADDDSAGVDDVAGVTDEDGEFDVKAAEGRLEEVGEQIDEAKRALADLEDQEDPKPDVPPIADGEGAANAPPG